MKIRVTQDDINKGVRRQVSYCPIALSLKRILGEKFYVCGEYYISKRGDTRFYFTKEIKEKIADFDRNEGMQPFSFIHDKKD